MEVLKIKARRVISNGVVSTKLMRSSKCKGMFSCHQRQVMKVRTMMFGSLEVQECKMLTNYILSKKHSTHFEAYKGPHEEAAITTGKSSLWAIKGGC